MKPQYFLLILLTLSAISVSCKKEKPAATTTTQPPAQTQTIQAAINGQAFISDSSMFADFSSPENPSWILGGGQSKTMGKIIFLMDIDEVSGTTYTINTSPVQQVDIDYIDAQGSYHQLINAEVKIILHDTINDNLVISFSGTFSPDSGPDLPVSSGVISVHYD